ncbi:RICIN domain-containing protein [Streptomyces microflavus]|uniref:RICIN domain-containing protein n=1 Tax=Streptomyces microflavus TaxID=1919 RepID=UPI003667EF4F
MARMQTNPSDRRLPSIHRAAAMMPDVPQLLARAEALATIGLIVDGYAPYRLDTIECSCGTGLALRVPNEGERWLQVHFHGEQGAIVFLWDVDADSAPYDPAQRDIWRQILAEVPDALRPCLHQQESTNSGDGELPFITAVMWRLPQDTAWRTADVLRGDDGIAGCPEGIDDRGLFVLTDLIAPAPATVMMGDGLEVERSSFVLAAAIRHIMGRKPLSDDVVRALNPRRSLADVAGAAAVLTALTAAPRPVRSQTPPGLTEPRTAADGAPLLTAPDMPLQYDLAHFLLEPDGEGYHRILVHHSGKALQTAGSGPGAGIVQYEPAGHDAQRFRLQEWADEAFHDVFRVPGFDLDGGVEDDEAVVQTGAVYRFLAKESGLALRWGARSGDPIVLVSPRDEDESQRFVRSDLYGHGLWMFLGRMGGSPQQAVIAG